MVTSTRRQDELEARLIEEETAKRVEEELAKRVQQLLYERKDEIEAEVLRRVEEAKKVGRCVGLVGGACLEQEEVLVWSPLVLATMTRTVTMTTGR